MWSLVILGLLVNGVLGWGAVGHQAIGMKRKERTRRWQERMETHKRRIKEQIEGNRENGIRIRESWSKERDAQKQ